MVQPPVGGGVLSMSAPPARPSPLAGPSLDSPGPPSKKQSKVPAVPGTLNGPPSGNNHAIPLSARRAEALDLNSVERRGQPNMRPYAEKRSRLFDIPNAPIYRPTEEEFRDPMEYMRKIAPEGSKYGIVKIVPPQTWNPPFAINTERFHFRTRRQELNSVEGGNRVNNDYLDQLAKFHKQNGHNLNRFPSVDKRPLDLYRLKKTVERKGGFSLVCTGKRWAEVGRDLGYSGKIMSSLSTSLKNSYQKWLLPYEEYLKVARPGVHHQLEVMNGGPYTPSPGPSPVKRQPGPMPGEHASTMQASAALHASLSGHSPHPPFPGNHEIMHPAHQHERPATPQSAPPPAPSAGGFTPVNAGGFTPVNAAPPPPASGGFTAVNGVNGMHSSNSGTPQRPVDTTPQNMTPQHMVPNPSAALKRPHAELTPDEVSSLERRSKRLRKDVPIVAGSNMHHSRMGVKQLQANRERGNYSPGEVCENCLKPDEPHRQLKCESCGDAYHMYCLEPPLKQAPPHEWHCPRCLVGTNEYGFDEGDVYSLSGFQRKANEFKMHHFNTMPRQFSPFTETKHHLTEDDVEREFWRLVEDISDTTEVEYGADIHSTTHGSGFPTIEKHPRDPYSTDPWNLNIMPLDKESLFRHIKSDVSGMTVPWLYVGMIFSTFCWHNEDHYTYSANYQHFGETKTWYGIPGEDSYKFEEAMKKEVPELFETQPDLLFQLVTLAKPEKLRKAGVRVYAIDQHAGEFVVTFPRAYHAGFNQGFNFNEAVNFAPHDWEPYGEEGVRRLRDYRKQPCFSHDEMLLTAAARDSSIRTSKWLAPALERMRDEELATREHFMKKPNLETAVQQQEYIGPRYAHKPEAIDTTTEEEEVICTFCKAYCHLSRYVCKKTKKVLCLLHAGSYECCDRTELERYSALKEEHVVFYRMTDDVLSSTVQRVVDKANIPEVWAAKVDKELDESPRPSLKHLRTLLAEGEKIQYDLPQLPDLRRFVDRCNEWVEEATNYITRKQTNRRKSEKAWRKGTKAAEQEERDRELRKISNIYNLLESADKIGFDCPEIVTLRERASSIEDFQQDANAALGDILAKTTEDFEELLERAKEFNVDMPEIESIEKVLKRLRWNDAAKAKKPNADTGEQTQTLKDIEKFLAEASEIGVPDTNPDVIFFKEHKAQGELWEQKAKELMAVEQVHYQQLDALSRQASTLPVMPSTLAEVDAILKKQREIQDKIASLVERSKEPDFRRRPHYNEMKEVMDALDELQSKPSGTIDLEKESKRHEDWMRRGKKLFGKANAPLHILQQHMNQVDVRNQSCFDIEDKPRGPVEPSSRAGSPVDGDVPITEGSTSSRDVFCICRKSEAGMMIECEICHEWYHGKCLKIARGKVKEDDKYTCPICDWRVKIPRDAARPKLEDLQSWLDELDSLPFQPVEEKTLVSICEYGQVFRDFVRPYVEPAMEPTPEEVSILRFYLRKVEGADILLAHETNYLRQQLHRLAKVAPEPPPMTDASHSTRKPRPTKQQKLMAQLGITNPEDLPTQYRMKPHIAKRKQSDAMSGMHGMNSASPPGSTTPGLPGSSNSARPYPSGLTPVPQEKVRKHLTALAIQVLGKTAGHPIVDEFLAQEPHANRDRLLKVKAVLELSDSDSFTTDLDTFKTKVNSMPMPAAHAPGVGYETPQERHLAAVQQRQNSQAREQSMFPNTSSDSYQAMTSQPQQRLGSPAMFHGYNSNGPSPPPPVFGSQMFGMNDMFNTPTTRPENTPLNNGIRTSPDFGGRQTGGMIPSGMPGGMFDSPKQPDGTSASTTGFTTTAGINSPGFGGSQQSVGANLDNVFADLVHETDDSFGVPGLEHANDVRESKEVPTSAPSAASGDVDMKDTADTVVTVHQLDEPKQDA